MVLIAKGQVFFDCYTWLSCYCKFVSRNLVFQKTDVKVNPDARSSMSSSSTSTSPRHL